jgi:peptidoglycan hydrolase-like protein with peptidoglycan-binding domain
MANYNQVSYGSKGSDVTELQKLLNKNGYSLDEDGVFGSKTQAAVQDYQKKNNLAVDGIVGNNTWGALTNAAGGSSAGSSSGSSSPSGSTQAPAPGPAPTYGAGDYKPSDTVLAAEQLLQQQLANKPGAYESAWSTQLNDTINKILNREKFSYDLNGDALYQQYKDKYIQQGQMAMMDTMGQAAAMTGGYGNSYAQSAGQQAYQGQLQNLNDIIPELYQMAMDQYNNEGQNLLNQYSMLGAQEEQDYGRYRDQVGDYNTELARLTEDARYQAEQDYGKWADDRAYSQWEAEFNEGVRQYEEQYGSKASTSGSSGSSSGSNNTGGGDYKSGDVDQSNIAEMQADLGVDADGKWGPKSQAAAMEKWGTSDPDEAYEKFLEGGGGPETPTSNGFTGTTYSEAVAYANSNGVPNEYSSSILTQSEWRRVKSSGGTRDHANEFDTYQEYLQYAVESMIDAYGK